MVQEYRLRIPAILEEVEAACEFVADIARSSGMGTEAIHQCYLSVEEICTNIIEHGYHYDGSDDVIEVVCERHPNRLTIKIIDSAAPFNPLAHPSPDPGAPLSERRGGGWGIYFVKRYMDRVDYQYKQNRNQFTIEKRF